MSANKQNEIVEFLREYPSGMIYTLAPKNYVIRGFDYYKSGKLKHIVWEKNFSVLSAKVQGTKLYSVDFSLNGEKLIFSCNCPAWNNYTQCKHVICSLLTIKNLLQPENFSTGLIQNEERRNYLLQCLFNHNIPLQENNKEKELINKKYSEYEIVLEKTNDFLNIYLKRRNGETISDFSFDIPFELRRLMGRYYSKYSRFDGLINLLQKSEGKYYFILKINKDETKYSFDSNSIYTCMTEIDLGINSVNINKICLRDNAIIERATIESDFVFDMDKNVFGIIKSKIGWMYWNELYEFNYNIIDYEARNYNSQTFSIPTEIFQKNIIYYPSKEGNSPKHLLLKVHGEKTKPVAATASYRLTIIPTEHDVFILKADCLLNIDNLISPTSPNLFGFFNLINSGLNSALRTNKRKKVLLKIFFDMLSEKSKNKAEEVIKQNLTSDLFQTYQLKQLSRSVLKNHLNIFFNNQNSLFIHNGRWIYHASDNSKELLLYKIPYEIFGFTIFNDIPDYDQMIIQSKDLYEKLPCLYERLKENNIELFFDKLPLKTTQLDFSFNVSRPLDIDWFEIKPEIRCDGELIDDVSFLEMIQKKGIVIKNDCVQIMDSNSKKILDTISTIYKMGGLSQEKKKEIVKVPRLQILDWIRLRGSGIKIKLPPEDENIIDCLTSFEKIEQKPFPSGLRAKLRQYQKDGYYWLSFLYENRFGACLADDMGLGKTVQAISLLAGIKEGIIQYPSNNKVFPHLVVLPPSLLFNWENEIKRFYPKMKIIYYTGKERNTSFDDADIVLTTYGLVRRDIDKLKDILFDVIVFDEAQAIKNIFADTTGAVRQLKAKFKLAMTGTPLENHIGEYYSIIDLSLPGLLGDFEDFKPLIKKDVSPSLEMIIRRTKPFILRRTKETILKELPPKTETDIYLELTEKQKAFYKKTVEQVKNTIDDAYRTKTHSQAKIIALTAILKLRQLCVSPQLIAPEIDECSPKIDFLIEKLKELIKGGHSSLVFSQFTSFLDILQEYLSKQELDFIRLDGSTPVGKRKRLIEEFQTCEKPLTFLLSLKAGGQGLNLTKASYVFHLDPWWNPAVENQASDRAHRIGQKNKVTITRILMRHTIEEKMMFLKNKKIELYKAVMDESTISKKGLTISKADFDYLLK